MAETSRTTRANELRGLAWSRLQDASTAIELGQYPEAQAQAFMAAGLILLSDTIERGWQMPQERTDA